MAALTLVLARFSLRARCCSIVLSGVPRIADAARGGEADLFELPSTSAGVARRARPPHTEGSEARLLEKLVPFTKGVADDPPPPPPPVDSVALDSDANVDATFSPEPDSDKELLDILDRVAIDDLLVVLSVANMCSNVCEGLSARCIELVTALPHYIVKQIMDARMELGLNRPECDSFPDKHVKRIHRALDSNDVELVRMLLREARTTLDHACALHYAVAYCDAKTTTELLDLGIADINQRNPRGYTILHVAALRKEPKIIVSFMELGKRFFPRCSAVINKIIDTSDLSWLGTVGDDSPEEQLRKKQWHIEVEEEMTEAYTQDKEETDKSSILSSSSSTSLSFLKSNGKLTRSDQQRHCEI
ncbi:hypothetical protein ACJRO7_022401 [Eucalyptus globulus]|uniref:NPR1/NIM1-like C-terminal domain-containing protein n=1 Tax=Eucalyptus globulus TaxID=34317 RepID=A0ABD3K2W4_EUCGL